MLTSGEINAIGQLLNTTWGSSLSGNTGDFPRGSSPPLSIKGRMVTTQTGEIQLALTYTDIVTFRSDQEVHAAVKQFKQIAERTCINYIAEFKKKFKSASTRALKMKFLHDQDSVETIGSTTPEVSLIGKPVVRPAIFRGYYRYTTVYTVS